MSARLQYSAKARPCVCTVVTSNSATTHTLYLVHAKGSLRRLFLGAYTPSTFCAIKHATSQYATGTVCLSAKCPVFCASYRPILKYPPKPPVVCAPPITITTNINCPQVWGARLRSRPADSPAAPASTRGKRGRRCTHDKGQHAGSAGLVHPASSDGSPQGLLAVLVVQEALRAGGGRIFSQVPVCLLRDQVPARSPRYRFRCGCCCE